MLTFQYEFRHEKNESKRHLYPIENGYPNKLTNFHNLKKQTEITAILKSVERRMLKKITESQYLLNQSTSLIRW